MALLFVLPLSSKPYMHKSFSSPTHYKLKAVCRTIPSLRMRKRGKLLKPPYTTMTLETAVSDHDGVQRRVGDYHSNIWDDDAIQSLPTPHGVTSYRERADRLTGDVKEMFNQISLENGESTTPRDDLIQRLWMVDSVERLGIERHFENEIKVALDHVYSYWNEKGIGKHSSADIDLNSTALGFRTLRLHGYPVSSEVLNVFKGQNGQFVCSPSHNIEEEIRSVLNLYRASLIAFPGEKVIEEAEIFSSRYLKEALQKLLVSSLSREIEHVMQYGWHTNLRRWEARNYIDMFGQDTIYSSSFSKNNETLLELAKLEFNIFHSLQQSELQSVVRWWKKSGVPSLTFTRHRHVEYYALASSISPEPKHSAFRLGFTKLCHLLTVLDDMYDTFGTLPELELFTTAVKRWDSSETKHLPEYMKGVYMAVFETVNELAREAEKTQGRNTLNYVRKAWEAHLDSFMEEAKWISSGCLPTFKDYHENGKVSSGYRTATLQPIFTLDAPLPDSILQGIDFPSRFNDLASSFLRLRGDTRCYKADIARGEEASAIITCYMKDNPGSTEEDALNHVNAMISEVIKVLNWELLRPDSNVPMSSRKHAFDLTRAFHHLYIYRDGFSDPHKETKTFVMKTLFESVPL